MTIRVLNHYVEISACTVDDGRPAGDYLACNNPTLAGPFLSGDDAVDWQRQFCNGPAELPTKWSDDEDACTDRPIFKQNGEWTR